MSALPDQGAGLAGAGVGGRHYSLSIGRVQRFVLWLFVFCGCFALFEPSPYEVMFLVTLFVFMVTGLRINAKLLPMIVLLLLFNIGGIFSLIPFMDEPDSVRFIAVGVYLMFTAILFAALLSDDAEGRLNTIRRGMIASAWLAASAGIIGYFNVGGLGQYLTLYNRASGTFKDPNVFGPFLVLPIVFVVQAILLKRIGLVAGILLMSVPVLGLFLSFSRGAWANLVGATLVLFVLTFLTAPNAAQRSRVIGFSILIVAAAVMALLALLSVDGIREIFNERASLNQSYDMGVQGRFGNQIRSIGMLLEMPNGMGPLRFRFHFPEDPHNTYINAFASYGWLGGFSYIALVVVTMIAGWTMVWRRSTVQPYAIAIWSVLFISLLQGIQIDIDHWRHVYLQLGLVWGLRAITPEPPREA
ncbi:MAG: O-antigen ligase domain-containing protein [Beijerinckiaceae bacterium]|nr:O-antigen ligase domain-containing protein [Beijerinckiaceae bacterium]